MPHTSIGGQFLGFEMYRSRGKKNKQGRKRQKNEKLGKRETKFTATFYVAVNIGCLYYEIGVRMRCLTKICPPSEVCAIFIYVYK